MKVYGSKPPEKQDASTKAQKPTKADQTSEKGAVEKISPVDRVALSGKAKGMAEMIGSINQMPEIRTEMVQEIEKSVNEGTYRVEPEKVASRMIVEMI